MAKKSFKPDYNACIGNNKHENFGSIYESMVKSEQFKALSSPARMHYVGFSIKAAQEKLACIITVKNLA